MQARFVVCDGHKTAPVTQKGDHFARVVVRSDNAYDRVFTNPIRFGLRQKVIAVASKQAVLKHISGVCQCLQDDLVWAPRVMHSPFVLEWTNHSTRIDMRELLGGTSEQVHLRPTGWELVWKFEPDSEAHASDAPIPLNRYAACAPALTNDRRDDDVGKSALVRGSNEFLLVHFSRSFRSLLWPSVAASRFPLGQARESRSQTAVRESCTQCVGRCHLPPRATSREGPRASI